MDKYSKYLKIKIKNIKCVRKYLSNEAFEGGELVDGEGHLGHVGVDVRRECE